MSAKDRGGNAIETTEEEENDPSVAPVYEGDFAFLDWDTWEDFLAQVGVIDIRNAMIEYETGNNSRMFIMLAEMQQSNPSLKTDEELAQANALMEVFLNGIHSPLKETSQSQKVEMTDFLNNLRDHSQYLRHSTPQMKKYARTVIDDTLNYQRETDRFENRCYLQFMATVTPEEVYGDSPEILEKQIHEKALEKLLRQISNADGILRRADHSLSPLDTFGLFEVLYKTFNRESSVKMRFEDIIRKQRFSLFTSARQSDKLFKEVQQRIQIEADLVNKARDAMWLQQQAENQRKIAKGEDYYAASDREDDYTDDSYNNASPEADESGNDTNDNDSTFDTNNETSYSPQASGYYTPSTDDLDNSPETKANDNNHSDDQKKNSNSGGIDIKGLEDLD